MCSSSSLEESVSTPQSGGFVSAFHSGSWFHSIVLFCLAFDVSWLNWETSFLAFCGSFMWASPCLTPRMGGCGLEWTHDLASVMR